MSEEEQVEIKIEENKVEVEETEANQAAEAGEATGHSEEARKEKSPYHLKDALKQVESFGQALGEALQGRGNVVMVRVNDEALEHLDMLIEAEITKSRSESAAFLINEGIAANHELFGKISAITSQIAELREQLRHEVKLEPQDEEAA
jgi:hypothetical protein